MKVEERADRKGLNKKKKRGYGNRLHKRSLAWG